MLSIKQKLKNYLDNKNYCRITRKVAENSFEDSYGYILDFSDDYILLQEVDQFSVEGYVIFPVWMVSQLRFNNHEKYYDKILRLEKESDKVMKKHKIDLTNWNSIFKSIKKEGVNVIVEDENPEIKIYEIGPLLE